jgi:MYXO-CTERM domain-containing protein
MNRSLLACAALALGAGSANAAFFSFASDSADHAWTYTGNGATISNGTNGNADPLTLMIDDENGLASPLVVSVSFSAQYTLTFVGSVNLPGGAIGYNYAASGQFVFNDIASGTALLTTNFSNALFSARGDQSRWFTTAGLQVDDSGGATVSMIWGGAALPQYGLAPGSLNGSPRGFAFGLSVINTSGSIPYNGTGPGVAINANTKLPTQQWFSESSYSANGRVPTPGTLALLGLGGLAMRRRRR